MRHTSPLPAYDRTRDLPGLIAVWPAELVDTSEEGRRRLIAKLRRALRAERRRGLMGHWTYDLARHAQLLVAFEAEYALACAGDGGSDVRFAVRRTPSRRLR
jgi:hypothetical protein